ncbi:HD-GYP domain-containing protein [Motilimonas cestriensis]|uniref:HD-GYP domain-containing protein n=1 Tax=Motilimonas cestriensis TaxID=2742685 RepID=A0ABS8WET9_9GAMM|nr:HD-GYP domain-containing protein [Motilimonas cestriensis]MCE2596837.1 HD-GYP domain-containing protein [Motilimonas cestriensis]
MAELKISVNRLQLGNYVKLPVNWGNHPFLFSNFKIKSQDQIDVIRNLGLKHVTIVPEKSDNLPLAANTPISVLSHEEEDAVLALQKQLWQDKQDRIEELKNYRRQLQKCEKEFTKSMSQVRSVMGKILSRPLNAINDAVELIETMAESLMNAENTVLHLMGESKETEALYYHSLNVSVLSMMLGKASGCTLEEIKMLGLGSLFHDIGTIKLPSKIVRRATPLTNAEENLYKMHCKYAIDLLKLVEDFPEQAKTIILQHHECADGSGYPAGLKLNEINELAQIVAVVNRYDNICHPTNIKHAKIPYQALSILFKQQAKLFNKDYLGRLIKLLGIYPPGSVVQLSNGQVGMVMSVASDRLLFPKVLVFDPAVPRTEAPIIDLEEAELTIEKVIKPQSLPPSVHEYLNPRVRTSYYFEHDKK